MSRVKSYKKLYFTNSQKRLFLISPHWYVGIFSRGTGKTTNMQAVRSFLTAKNIPGGLSVFYNATYIGAQQRTVANTIAGWKKLGLVEGQDYVRNIRPPKSFSDNPDYDPTVWKNIITFRNGHIFVIGSNDSPGLVNSLTINGGIFVDECRFINEPLMRQDLYPAIRGEDKFGKYNPFFKSRTYTSDMPFIHDESDWLFDFEKLMNKEQIILIAQASVKVEKVKNKIVKHQKLYQQAQKYDIKNKYLNKINSLNRTLQKKQFALNKIRMAYLGKKGSVYYDTGSFLANIAILKKEYFFDNVDIRNQLVAKTSFLNIRPQEVENKFYSQISSKHFIIGHFDNYKIQEFGIADVESKSPLLAKHILDYDPNKPIDVEFDYGDMCSCSISQTFGREERYIASFEVLLPFHIDDLIDIINDFLTHHVHKVIHVYKDPSGNYQKNRKKQVYGEQTIQKLKALGWFTIDKCPVGSINPSHDAKHTLINAILRETNSRMPLIRIIRETNKQLENSLNKAPRIIKFNRDGVKQILKDKSSEKLLKLEDKPLNSTDHSDHFDIKLWHKYNHLLPYPNLFT
ncbi:MAG: hypothetical protein J7K53_11305 [Bacteroidales bacterium]|nr:hypothetical protein [Bacteroidales bacterium]